MVKHIDLKRLCVVSIAGVIAISASACSTTQTVKVSKAAPITYKIDQNGVKMAALRTPSVPSLSTLPQARPSYTIPSPYTPQGRPAPRPQVSAPTPKPPHIFDPNAVDRDLYKHQRVGKRYTIMGKSYTPAHDPDYDRTGEASWYGDKFHGKPTATGEIYNKNDMTAAHKTLPLNSMLHVTNLDNGRTAIVRLNDRGPFIGDRIIDLSEAAARYLGTVEQGVGRVRVRYMGPADPMAPKRLVEAPQPAPKSLPQLVPQATPQPAPQTYKPLRDQVDPRNEVYRTPDPMPAPQSQPEYAPYNAAPQPTPQLAEPYSPGFPAPAQPLPVEPSDGDDSEITLTIKGPIHMAKSTSEQPRARWIDAVNRRTFATDK